MKPTRDERARELDRCYRKASLAVMHKENGGMMPLKTYLKWRKDELIAAVLRDEGYKE
jgi:hypothetical protein